MQLRLISTCEHWSSIASDWDGLASANPFCQWDWLSTWWKHYGTNHELRVVAAYNDEGALIGAAPFYAERSASFGTVIRQLGSGEVCSEYVTVLCKPEHEDEVTRTIASWLAGGSEFTAESPFAWDVLMLESMPVTDSTTVKLVARFVESDCTIRNMPRSHCWRIDLPATWQGYLALLSKSHRKEIKRLIRDRWETGRARLWTARSECELNDAMKIFEELHQRRWRAAGKPGVFASERFQNFLFDVAPKLWEREALNLAVLEIDGRPAAVDFHLVSKQASFVYQGGIEPELAAESPGRLLTALLIRDAIDQGQTCFDFLRGDEPYKPHFRATPFTTHDIHVVSPRTGSQIRHGLWRTGMTMKGLFRSGMSLAGMHHGD